MSVSLGRRLALLEARLKALQKQKDVEIVVKDFAQPGATQERVEAPSERLYPCPGDCGAKVRSGWPRCDNCHADLAWPER